MEGVPSCLTYREYAPAPELTALVRCYWTIAGTASLERTHTNRVLPDGCIDVIIEVAGSQPRAIAVGAMLEPAVIQHVGEVDMIGVRFVPGAAPGFLSLPARDLTDNVVPADEIWADSAQLVEALITAVGRSARMRVLDAFLLRKLNLARRADLALEAMQLIQRSRGLLSLASLRESLGVAERALQRSFDAAVGLSPKQALRITRFRYAVALLQRQPALPLARVALIAGYADQAHFTREFRALAGITPGYYRGEQGLVGFVQDPTDVDAYIRGELAATKPQLRSDSNESQSADPGADGRRH